MQVAAIFIVEQCEGIQLSLWCDCRASHGLHRLLEVRLNNDAVELVDDLLLVLRMLAESEDEVLHGDA